jgi:hypothetical protein
MKTTLGKQTDTKPHRFVVEIEGLPEHGGDHIIRLRKALKSLGRHGFRCTSIKEVRDE